MELKNSDASIFRVESFSAISVNSTAVFLSASSQMIRSDRLEKFFQLIGIARGQNMRSTRGS
jgi:hypothetical protein